MIAPKPLYSKDGKPYLKPKPKRHGRKAKMTIAAGFVCLDGIVLAADTQETIAGYTKSSTEKIRIWMDQGLSIAITGAGDSDLIETIGAEIEWALTAHYSRTSVRMPEKVSEIIQGVMSSAFQKYILPYASFPKDDRPYCELLIVVAVKNEVNEYERLFKAAGTTVREISFGAECIGSGLILAKSLIERFFSSFLRLDDGTLAAAYVMHQTKKWVDGCGGNTDLVVSSMRHNIFHAIGSYDLNRVEAQFEKSEQYVNPLIVDLLNPNRDSRHINRLISFVKTDRKKALKDVYRSGALGGILKRLATKPSTSQKSKGQP